jgi:hypothetical protein
MARSNASYMGNHSGSPVQVHLPPCACSATIVGSDKGSAPTGTGPLFCVWVHGAIFHRVI